MRCIQTLKQALPTPPPRPPPRSAVASALWPGRGPERQLCEPGLPGWLGAGSLGACGDFCPAALLPHT